MALLGIKRFRPFGKTRLSWGLAGLCLFLAAITACSDPVSDIVGPSNSGFSIGIKAFYGEAGLPADGT